MIDKVTIWLDRVQMGGVAPKQIVTFLDEGYETTKIQTGEVSVSGHIENLIIKVGDNGVSIIGSLPKYLHGNNIFSNRGDTKQAINKLEDTLHINLSEALVTSLEFGTTFRMKHPVSSYIQRLGDIPRLERCNIDGRGSTLYYQHKGKQQPKVLCFYDKGAEIQCKGRILSNDLIEANLLRYELRYKGRLAHQIGCPKVIVSTLSEPSFMGSLLDLYKKYYFSIQKHNQLKTNVMGEIRTVKDAYEVFIARVLCQSPKAQVKEFLDELKENKVFTNREYYTRLKNKLNSIASKASITITDELIKELDDNINNLEV